MNHSPLTEIILAECRTWLGTPYQHQGSVKHLGCDCLGLLRGIWRHLFECEPQEVPFYTSDWGEADANEPLLTAANKHLIPTDQKSAGNVVLFRWRPELPAKHVGILTGCKSFIHAYERAGVIESTLGHHWGKKVVGLYRFPDPEKLKEI